MHYTYGNIRSAPAPQHIDADERASYSLTAWFTVGDFRCHCVMIRGVFSADDALTEIHDVLLDYAYDAAGADLAADDLDDFTLLDVSGPFEVSR